MKDTNVLSYNEMKKIIGGLTGTGCSMTNGCHGGTPVSCSCPKDGSCNSTSTGVECHCGGQPLIYDCAPN